MKLLLVRVVDVVSNGLLALARLLAVLLFLWSLIHLDWKNMLIAFVIWWVLNIVKSRNDKYRVLPGLGITMGEAQRRLAERKAEEEAKLKR
jgi:hypothetical protein